MNYEFGHDGPPPKFSIPDVHVHIHANDLERLSRKLDRVLHLLHHLTKGQIIMSLELDTLEQKIAPLGSAVDSAVVLLDELAAIIRAAANDPARILAVADELELKTTALADAVVANTPAAP